MPPEAVAAVAAVASEAVAELVATNEQRLLAFPEIIEKLYMNKATRMSTADRILELAVRNNVELHGIAAYKEAATAIGMELIAEPRAEPTPDDVLFKKAESADGPGRARRGQRRTPTASTRRPARRSSRSRSLAVLREARRR